MRYAPLVLIILSGCFLFHHEKPIPDTTKQHLIISVDKTKSMNLSDPDSRAIDFASALSVLLPPSSTLSALALGQTPQTLIKQKEISSSSDRLKIEKYLRKQEALGTSFDYESALNDASKLADSAQGGVPSFVLISDGYNQTKSTPDKALVNFQKNKWHIDAVVVTPKENVPILSNISEKTGGVLLRPDTLFEFVLYLKKFYPNWRLFKGVNELGSPANRFVVPDKTYRLFVIAARGSDNAYLTEANFSEDKKPQKITRYDSSVSAYPYRADKIPSVFDVTNFENPPSGACSFVFSSKPKDYQVWAMLPISIKADGTPETMNEGEELTIRLTVSVDSKENLPLLKAMEGGNLTVRLVSKDGVTPPIDVVLSPVSETKTPPQPSGEKKEPPKEQPKEKTDGKDVKKESTPKPSDKPDTKKETPKEAAKEMPKTEEQPLSKTYEGKVRVFLRKRADERFSIVYKAVLRYPKFNMWLCEQERPLLVKAATIPVTVEPATVSFPPCWVDEPSAPIQLKVKSEYPHKLVATVIESPNWVSISPTSGALGKGAEAQFTISLLPDTGAISGERRGTISFDIKTEDGNDFGKLSMPVSSFLLKLNLKKGVETVVHPGGEFEVEIGTPIEPSVPLNMEVLQKDDKSKINLMRLESKEGKLVLLVSVPKDAQEEKTEIKLAISPKDYKVKPKIAEITALVRAHPKLTVNPQEITLAAEKGGDYEVNLELTLDHYEEVELEAAVSDILGEGKHKLSASAGEVKVTDKLTLEPNKATELKVQFFVSPDIHNGIYQGEVVIVLKYNKGERETSFKVPIKLEIKK